MVPSLSILFMAISCIISIGLPIALFMAWRKKYSLKAVPMLVGAAAFIVFALVLESLLHQIVLRPQPDGTIGLRDDSPWLFVAYGCFAAGVFEETARFISFKLLKKKYEGVGTGLSYGIGHGGIESVLLAGVAMISNIALSIMLNSGSAALIGNADSPAMKNTIDALLQTDAPMFLIGGIERILAVAVQISLSMFVWCAVRVKGKLWLYPAAILAHAAVDVAPAMYQAGIIESVLAVEVVLFVLAALVALAAYKICKTIAGVVQQPLELESVISKYGVE